uniref:Uncharacterized protein n=1 Tax=Cacopsylla melanoneura TaxID=428564 RepID=A0A8D8TLD5_9HEMI
MPRTLVTLLKKLPTMSPITTIIISKKEVCGIVPTWGSMCRGAVCVHLDSLAIIVKSRVERIHLAWTVLENAPLILPQQMPNQCCQVFHSLLPCLLFVKAPSVATMHQPVLPVLTRVVEHCCAPTMVVSVPLDTTANTVHNTVPRVTMATSVKPGADSALATLRATSTQASVQRDVPRRI